MDATRDIPEFSGYRIDTAGNGWSCRVPKAGAVGERWKPLKPAADESNGYLYFRLRRGGKTLKRYVHRLVLETFVGPCPEGMEGCHGDGDRANCHLENLRWDTPVNNQADKIEHGTTNRGTRQGHSKLNEQDVRDIFAIRRDIPNATMEDIGILFGVAKTTIQGVLERRNWGWLSL